MIRNIWRIQDSYAMKAVVELQTASRNILMLFLSSGRLWHWHFVSVLSRGVWDNVVYMATCNKQKGQELEPPWGREISGPI